MRKDGSGMDAAVGTLGRMPLIILASPPTVMVMAVERNKLPPAVE
jgi:hypothetical protein